MGLGFKWDSSEIRVPKPPARITAFMTSLPYLIIIDTRTDPHAFMIVQMPDLSAQIERTGPLSLSFHILGFSVIPDLRISSFSSE
jgi:hypothetical protein